MSTDSSNGEVLFEHIDNYSTVLKEQFAFIRQDNLALFGVVFVGLFILLGLFGPYLAPHNPIEHTMQAESGEIMRLSSPSSPSVHSPSARRGA